MAMAMTPIGERVASMESKLETLKDGQTEIEEKLDSVNTKLFDLERKIDKLMYLGLGFAVVGGVLNEKTVELFTRFIGS